MFIEALFSRPVIQESYPTPLIPGVSFEKGRERLVSTAKNVWELAKNRVKQAAQVVGENRALSLAIAGVGLRMAMGALSNGDMHSVDTLSKAVFSGGMIIDKAAIPLVEKFTGIEVDKYPLLSKLRNGLRDAISVSAGMALGGLAESAVVFADEPKGADQNSLPGPKRSFWGDDPDVILKKLDESGKNFIQWGGPVLENGTVILEHTGVIAPSEMPEIGMGLLPDDIISGSDVASFPESSMHPPLSVETPPAIATPTQKWTPPEFFGGKQNMFSTQEPRILVPPAPKEGIDMGNTTFPTFESVPAMPVHAMDATVSISPGWEGVLENGEQKIQNLLNMNGVDIQINHDRLVTILNEAITDFENGVLDDHSPKGRLFHLANGTGDYQSWQTDRRSLPYLVDLSLFTA